MNQAGENISKFKSNLPVNVKLIAVSKTVSKDDILEVIMQVIKFLVKIKFRN